MDLKYKKEYEALIESINEHNYNYYTLDKPKISDYEYDKLFLKLVELERLYPKLKSQYSPTQKVGGEVLSSFEKVNHLLPMLSLQNTFNPEELQLFIERVQKALEQELEITFICEPKLDGLALEIVYENGLLTSGITRGDGQIGEDVTNNVKTISTLPLYVPELKNEKRFEVRGEVVMFKKDFLTLNQTYEEQGLEAFSNPRNAAAGSIRQLDSSISAKRPLRFFAYSPGVFDNKNITSQLDFLSYIDKLRIPTLFKHPLSLIKKTNKIHEIIEYYHLLETIRPQLDFEIDGIVVKVNSFTLQNQLGAASRYPRWATAGKFKPQQSETIVESINIQVGRTGALTPVAQLKPVKVGGVIVTSATLHNQDEIDRKDIRIGDSVYIQRAGDVIPEVVSVNLTKRSKTSKVFLIPNTCPICHSECIKLEEEVVKRCVNPSCPAIFKSSIKHFVSKKAMNIDKLGEKITEQLIDYGLVKNYADIYKLDKKQLLTLERQGEKSVENILKSIEKSKFTDLHRFLFALGIRFVGEQTARILANEFKSIENLLKSDEPTLLSLNDIGPKVTHSILQTLANDQFLASLHELLEQGITFKTIKENESNSIKKETFVITGSFTVPRDEIKNTLLAKGFRVSQSISKNTTYLLVGDKAGSKLEKAQKLGINVLTLEDFVTKFNISFEKN